MDTQQAIIIVSTAPFRALIAAAAAVARAQGRSGIGFDPNRAGGKAQVIARLCATLGAANIAAELTRATESAPQGGPASREQGTGEGDHSDAPAAKAEGGPRPPAGEGQSKGDNKGASGGEQAEGGESAEGDGGEQAEGDKGDGAGEGGDKGDGGEQAEGEGGDKGTPPAPGAKGEQAEGEGGDKGDGEQAEGGEQAQQQAEGRDKGAGEQAQQQAEGEGEESPPAPGSSLLHPMFPKLLALMAQGVNVLLVGPPGTGKTTAAKMAADMLGRHFSITSLSGGVSESALQGWLLPVGEGGRFEYVPSSFSSSYGGEHGPAVVALDELDAAQPDMLVLANSALANGYFSVPQRYRAPMIHKGDVLLCAMANTLGDGSGSSQFTGRSALDAATLDRFYVLLWDMSPELESALLLGTAAPAPWQPAHNWAKVSPKGKDRARAAAVKWVQDVRAKAAEVGIERFVTIRTAQRFLAALAAGIGANEAKRDLLASWSDDERARLGRLYPAADAPAATADAATV